MSKIHPHEHFLLSVSQPQQYIGSEWNLNVRNSPDLPRVTLVYPDVYELGMSNHGLHILNHILSKSGKFAVGRAYAPAPDMNSALTENSADWIDLDYLQPVVQSTVIGFGVPTEILYTNVLNLLLKMGLKLRSIEREETDPIILVGGGGISNPLPIAPFADICFLGEVEESALELFEILTSDTSKTDRLKKVSKMPGVYIPAYGKQPVEIQRISSLKKEDAPVKQLVPIGKISHDRAVVEIARGCTRGCRFCQASQTGRPVRERLPVDTLELLDESICSTGWERAGFVTLSYSDYTGLEQLHEGISQIEEKYAARVTNPSLRPDSFHRLSGGHRINGRMTIAPEAGSESLRLKINKPMTDLVIIDAARKAFELGATGLKLYFIIGLPGETDEDLFAIGDLSKRIAAVAREFGKKPKKCITVSLSPFVPKAHSPLQWKPQLSADELWRRIKLARQSCKKVKVSWNSTEGALLEALLSLGDDGQTADMLEKAVRVGACFDAWTDRFRSDIWKELFAEYSQLVEKIQTGRCINKPLPWDFISTGVRKDYLQEEYRKFERSMPTTDCRLEVCSGCGACEPIPAAESRPEIFEIATAQNELQEVKAVLRIKTSKTGLARFSSHLDAIRLWGRVIRRAGLPVSRSEGYVRRSRMQFGSPLPLGMESTAEYIDMFFAKIPEDDVCDRLTAMLPSGFGIIDSFLFDTVPDSPDRIAEFAEYEITPYGNVPQWDSSEMAQKLAECLIMDIPMIKILDGGSLRYRAEIGNRKANRPDKLDMFAEYPVIIRRTELFVDTGSGMKPLLRTSRRTE